jgi:hypothetical protein
MEVVHPRAQIIRPARRPTAAPADEQTAYSARSIGILKRFRSAWRISAPPRT